MKCPVCNYEYIKDYVKPENDKGDEKFIFIDGHFTVKNTSYYGGIHEVGLVACPKCNCIILDD